MPQEAQVFRNLFDVTSPAPTATDPAFDSALPCLVPPFPSFGQLKKNFGSAPTEGLSELDSGLFVNVQKGLTNVKKLGMHLYPSA